AARSRAGRRGPSTPGGPTPRPAPGIERPLPVVPPCAPGHVWPGLAIDDCTPSEKFAVPEPPTAGAWMSIRSVPSLRWHRRALRPGRAGGAGRSDHALWSDGTGGADHTLWPGGTALALKRHGPSSPRLPLFGQNLAFPLPALPITIRVLLPGAGGTADGCGEEVFPDTQCFFRNQGNKLICRTEGGRRPIE